MSLRPRSALLALPGVVLMAQAPAPRVVQTPAPVGGAVVLDLEAGEYEVVPSDKGQVTVTWTEGDRVRVRTEDRDGGVRVRVGRTPRHHFKARIEVPKVCTLKIRLTAGELHVGAIEGSKDIRSRAGEVHLEVPDPKAYGRVYASNWAGEIHAQAFGGGAEGLFRSFEHQGPGHHTLKVKVMAGEIHLGK